MTDYSKKGSVEKSNLDFGWFVNQFGGTLSGSKVTLSLDAANSYADKGVQFLQSLIEQTDQNENSNIDNEDSNIDNANYILWALIRFAYQNNYVFGKGMFNLIFSDDVEENNKIVMRLNAILRKNSYHRLSSHYPDATIAGLSSPSLGISIVRGLDVDHSAIPCPANFETILFAPIKMQSAEDARIAMAFKPETSSFDVSRTVHAFLHTLNWIESNRNPAKTKRTPHGTHAFREKPGKRNDDYIQNANLRSSELVVKVTSKGLTQEKSHVLIRSADYNKF